MMNCFLVTYDIPNDSRRVKVATALEGYGQRVQFSVFEIWVTGAMQRELRQTLEGLIDAEQDSVRLYQLCAACQGRVTVLGEGEPPAAPGVLII